LIWLARASIASNVPLEIQSATAIYPFRGHGFLCR
jgi:hypothetical protein